MKEVNVGALIRLKRHKDKLTRQQFKTLQGQIFAGDPAGSMKGLEKLLLLQGITDALRNKK